jgi:DNA-binding response OmpR family regulator
VAKGLLLLVEDEVLLHIILEETLTEAGFEVLTCTSGTEAVRQLDADAERFRAVLSDIRLGEGPDGWEIGRRVRELVPHMPVLYMSGDSAHEWKSKGVPDSMVLGKPFAMTQLTVAVSLLTALDTTGAQKL